MDTLYLHKHRNVHRALSIARYRNLFAELSLKSTLEFIKDFALDTRD